MSTTNINRSSTLALKPPVVKAPISEPRKSTPIGHAKETRQLPIEQRSDLLGKSLARDTQFTDDFYLFAWNPKHVIQSQSNDNLIASLLHELCGNPSERGHANPSEEKFIQSASHSIRQLFGLTDHWLEPTREACFAKLTMPLYLHAATVNQAGVKDFSQIKLTLISLLRELCAMIEMDNALSQHGFTEWLSQSQRREKDPRLTISNSFQVSVPLVANSLVRAAIKKSQPSHADAFHSAASHASTIEHLHPGWWSLATQWCRKQTALTLPHGFTVGVVHWDRLREHWARFYSALHACHSHPSSHADTSGRSQSSGQDSPIASNESTTSHEDQIRARWLEKIQSSSIPSRIIEIRSSNDASLGQNMDLLLQQCRADQGTLALVVLRHIDPSATDDNACGLIREWQSDFIDCMDAVLESNSVRGYVTESGELALVFEETERNELAQCVRDAFTALNQSLVAKNPMAANRPVPLIAGIAAVSAPSRSFGIEQLINAAWRCLDGAAVQGAGAVKSIEVY